MERKPDRFLASLSGLGITLVVLGHSKGVFPGDEVAIRSTDDFYNCYISLLEWIYTFHMPLFFFISGYLFQLRTSPKLTSFTDYASRRCLRLLVPYVVLSGLAFPIKAVLAEFAYRPLDLSLFNVVHQILFPWQNAIIFFWFLPTLFLLSMLAPFIGRSLSNAWSLWSVGTLSIATYLIFPHYNADGLLGFFNIGGALHNLVFFFLGIVIAADRRGDALLAMGPVALVVSIGMFAADLSSSALPALVAGVAGIAASWWLAALVDAEILARIGDYSFQIFLFSWFPQIFIRVAFRQMSDIEVWITSLSMLIAGLVVPIALTKLVHAAVPRRMRFLLGA